MRKKKRREKTSPSPNSGFRGNLPRIPLTKLRTASKPRKASIVLDLTFLTNLGSGCLDHDVVRQLVMTSQFTAFRKTVSICTARISAIEFSLKDPWIVRIDPREFRSMLFPQLVVGLEAIVRRSRHVLRGLTLFDGTPLRWWLGRFLLHGGVLCASLLNVALEGV